MSDAPLHDAGGSSLPFHAHIAKNDIQRSKANSHPQQPEGTKRLGSCSSCLSSVSASEPLGGGDRHTDSFPSPWLFTTFPALEFAHTFTADSFCSTDSPFYEPTRISKTEPPLFFKCSFRTQGTKAMKDILSTSSEPGWVGRKETQPRVRCCVWVSVLSRNSSQGKASELGEWKEPLDSDDDWGNGNYQMGAAGKWEHRPSSPCRVGGTRRGRGVREAGLRWRGK